jgi:hypothetical protein
MIALAHSKRHFLLVLCLTTSGCATLRPQPQTTTEILAEIDYYWHNQSEDQPPGSYTRVIDGYERYLGRVPDDVDAYTTVAWLLWSRWVTNGKKAPDDLNQAIRLLQQGCRMNETDGNMAFESAYTMLPVARQHDSKIYHQIAAWLDSAFRAGIDPKRLKRAHLMRLEALQAVGDAERLSLAVKAAQEDGLETEQ